MWMIELATKTTTAERTIGSHKDITGTIATSCSDWLEGPGERYQARRDELRSAVHPSTEGKEARPPRHYGHAPVPGSPTAKALEAVGVPNVVRPVACALVAVRVPVVGRVHAPFEKRSTWKLLVLAPLSTSAATKWKTTS